MRRRGYGNLRTSAKGSWNHLTTRDSGGLSDQRPISEWGKAPFPCERTVYIVHKLVWQSSQSRQVRRKASRKHKIAHGWHVRGEPSRIRTWLPFNVAFSHQGQNHHGWPPNVEPRASEESRGASRHLRPGQRPGELSPSRPSRDSQSESALQVPSPQVWR
jgi:hypothetical protein